MAVQYLGWTVILHDIHNLRSRLRRGGRGGALSHCDVDELKGLEQRSKQVAKNKKQHAKQAREELKVVRMNE